jgi:hypothetical protein
MPNIDSQDWRNNYDKLRGQYQKLFNERKQATADYETTSKTTLDDMLSNTLPAAKKYLDESNQMGDVTSENYIPGVKKYMEDAEGYDTQQRRDEASGRAMSDVEVAGNQARQSALARLESYGIDPSVTRSASLDQNARISSALEAVKQGRDASIGVEERGRAYRSDALDKGSRLSQEETARGAMASDMYKSALGAANDTADEFTKIYGSPQQNLQNQKSLIDSSWQAKNDEIAGKLNKRAQGNPTLQQVGQITGAVAGGAAMAV